jgi:phosphoribosylamine--glycine ligase
MKVLIIGQGGREHAMAWKIAQSSKVSNVFVAPGNAGTALENKVENINIAYDNVKELLTFAQTKNIDLTIVGPEVPLVLGIVNLFKQNNLFILGPEKLAAQLESSKSFCKKILKEANVPTAEYKEFTNLASAKQYLTTKQPPYVIKADGLAAGKGVVIVHTKTEAIEIIKTMLSGKAFGIAGKKIIIENYVQGKEISFIAVIANGIIIPMASSQDHKTRDNFDAGPNTGGMGAYSPTLAINPNLNDDIIATIIKPTIDTLTKYKINYTGFLHTNLIIDKYNKIWVLEFNCRLGDPEAQVILPRLKTDFFDLCYLTAQNKLETINNVEWLNKSAIGVVLASRNYPQAANKNEIITGLNHHNQDDLCKIFHSATYLDKSNNLRTNGGRVLTITTLANNLHDARELAYTQIQNISWPSMFYRTDIGVVKT